MKCTAMGCQNGRCLMLNQTIDCPTCKGTGTVGDPQVIDPKKAQKYLQGTGVTPPSNKIIRDYAEQIRKGLWKR